MSIKNKYIGILLMATAMLLNACSSDNTEAQTDITGNEPVGKEVQLMSYASPFTDKEQTHRAAPTAPTGFTAYTPDKTTNMGVYMLLPENLASPKLERITYNSSTGISFFQRATHLSRFGHITIYSKGFIFFHLKVCVPFFGAGVVCDSFQFWGSPVCFRIH